MHQLCITEIINKHKITEKTLCYKNEDNINKTVTDLYMFIILSHQDSAVVTLS